MLVPLLPAKDASEVLLIVGMYGKLENTGLGTRALCGSEAVMQRNEYRFCRGQKFWCRMSEVCSVKAFQGEREKKSAGKIG